MEYVVNNNQTQNPGKHHEVHKSGCEFFPKDYTFLGEYHGCSPAVERAKMFYSDADGCKTCCLPCHTG